MLLGLKQVGRAPPNGGRRYDWTRKHQLKDLAANLPMVWLSNEDARAIKQTSLDQPTPSHPWPEGMIPEDVAEPQTMAGAVLQRVAKLVLLVSTLRPKHAALRVFGSWISVSEARLKHHTNIA
ncbi:hypothetical protein E6O75_ATG00904 [Venturia nashicola]|uniref:Uncharacterized protein n=1 Tax=Venturia nashicola TaxID=86259 RepID=A0A4Z1PKM2_9PEZI|nr:hypothetical protein E6O75_ATG00904 [Venturia nashicola]